MIEFRKFALFGQINFGLSCGREHGSVDSGVLFALVAAVSVHFHKSKFDVLGRDLVEGLLRKRLQILRESFKWLHRFD